MTWKKLLASTFVAFVLAVTAIFILNSAFPQLSWITQPIITFVTVDAPRLIQEGIAYIAGTITAITGVIAVTMRQVGQAKTEIQTTKDRASAQVSETTQMAQKVMEDNAKLLEANKAQAEQITTLQTQVQASNQTAENLKTSTSKEIMDLQTQKVSLESQLRALQDIVRVNGVAPDSTDQRVIENNTPRAP